MKLEADHYQFTDENQPIAYVLKSKAEAALAAAVAAERAWWIEHTEAVHGKISEMLRSARGAAHD